MVILGKGAKAQGPRLKPATRSNPAVGFTHTKDKDHGEEEEDEEEVQVNWPEREPRIGAAPSV
jgi:hypothetical protein